MIGMLRGYYFHNIWSKLPVTYRTAVMRARILAEFEECMSSLILADLFGLPTATDVMAAK